MKAQSRAITPPRFRPLLLLNERSRAKLDPAALDLMRTQEFLAWNDWAGTCRSLQICRFELKKKGPIRQQRSHIRAELNAVRELLRNGQWLPARTKMAKVCELLSNSMPKLRKPDKNHSLPETEFRFSAAGRRELTRVLGGIRDADPEAIALTINRLEKAAEDYRFHMVEHSKKFIKPAEVAIELHALESHAIELQLKLATLSLPAQDLVVKAFAAYPDTHIKDFHRGIEVASAIGSIARTARSKTPRTKLGRRPVKYVGLARIIEDAVQPIGVPFSTDGKFLEVCQAVWSELKEFKVIGSETPEDTLKKVAARRQRSCSS